jgi:hypothetical protein
VTAWACTVCGVSGAGRPEFVEHAGDVVDLEADAVQPLAALFQPRCDRAGPKWLDELHLVSARGEVDEPDAGIVGDLVADQLQAERVDVVAHRHVAVVNGDGDVVDRPCSKVTIVLWSRLHLRAGPARAQRGSW